MRLIKSITGGITALQKMQVAGVLYPKACHRQLVTDAPDASAA